MKKFTLSILFILYFSIHGFSSDYLKIIFKNKDSIPTSTKGTDSVNINFNDENLNKIFKKYKVSKFEKEYPIADSFPDYMASAVRLRLVYQVRLSGDPTDKIKKLKEELDSTNSPDIDTVIQTNDPIALSTPPNDYYNCFTCGIYPQAHQHLDLINALAAWDITKGLACVKIGIVDEYFQHHVDLDNKVDNTPRTASIAPASTSASHGVEVAGMAGAETNNNAGISSLGYNIRLLYYDWNQNYNGIVNAIYDGCKVVNCSWLETYSASLLLPPPDVQNVLDLAKLNNVTIVAAAGNNNTGTPTDYIYPASYDGVISVTAVGSQWNVGDPHLGNWKDCHRRYFDTANKATYNATYQHNDRVDICAPGYYIETTVSGNRYGDDAGTSFSAPLVSAAAALLYSINPFFTPAQIEGYLKNNAANIYGVYDNYLWTGKLGAGRLDAAASLKAALNQAYTGNYCNSCPLETTYLTVTDPNLPPISGYFYNKDIYAGSNNNNVVYTSNSISTTLVATSSIVLSPEFDAVATANSSFSARIQPCTTPVARAIVNNVSNYKREELRIYPNPSTNIITITYSLPEEGQVDIEIMNSVGVVVKKYRKNIHKLFLDKTEIDVRNLQDGLYYVVMRCATNTYTNKFLKL